MLCLLRFLIEILGNLFSNGNFKELDAAYQKLRSDFDRITRGDLRTQDLVDRLLGENEK